MSQCQIVNRDILLEFLEVAFHGILYVRQLYPDEIFVKKKLYSTGVFISEHPEVNEYIKNILDSIRELILNNEDSVRQINFVFYDTNQKPIEKFVFDLFNFRSDFLQKDPYFLKTELALRELYLKLMTTRGYLKNLPEGSSFQIEIDTYEAAHVGLSENDNCLNFPWISKKLNSTSDEIKDSSLLPLSTIKTEYLGLQMFVISSNSSEVKMKESENA